MRIDLIERLNYCGRTLETSALSRTVEELEEAGQLMQQAAAVLIAAQAERELRKKAEAERDSSRRVLAELAAHLLREKNT